MSKDTQPHTTSSRRSFKHISLKVRQLIESLFRKKSPVSQIAREMGFHRSTIYRELKRGHVIHVDSQLRKSSSYSADSAQDASSLTLSSRGPDLKIASYHSLVSLLRSLILDSKSLLTLLFKLLNVSMMRCLSVPEPSTITSIASTSPPLPLILFMARVALLASLFLNDFLALI